MAKMEKLEWVATILVLIGALNWGLVGIFGYNLVAELFGAVSTMAKVIYIAIGLAAVYSGYALLKEVV